MSRRAVLLSVLTAVGCSDGSTPPTVELDVAASEVGVAMCERLTDCSVLGLALLSQTACEVGAYQYRNGTLAGLEAWVADGTVSYDGEALRRCLDGLPEAACADQVSNLLVDVPGCDDAIVGAVTTGGACDSSWQCAAGLFCELDAACPGTCAPRGGVAAACAGDDGCQAGLDCVGGACATMLTAGDTCDNQHPCPLGLNCDRATGETTGTCRALVFTAGLGEPCDPGAGQLCTAALVCAALDTTGDAWECRAPSSPSAACATSAPSACPVGTVCLVASGEASGTCTALPGDGAACLQPGSLVLTCQEDLACDTATDTCVRRVDNGEACTSEAQCLHACDGGTCTAPGC